MSKFITIRILAAQGLIIALLMPPLPAQDTQTTSREPVIKVSTDRVLVNVVVRDKKGAIVRGLKPEDLTVLEDGKPQRLSSFDFEEVDVQPLAPAESATSPADQPVTEKILTTKSDLPVPVKGKRLIVLLFDFSGMEPEEIERTVNAVMQYLDKQMAAADLVAVTSFSTALRIDQDFTSDRTLLKKAVSRFSTTSGQGYSAGSNGDTEGTSDNGNTFTADDSDFNTFNTDRKLQAIQSLSDAMAKIQEKKSILYFSNGVSRNGMENQSQLRATINAAVKANVTLYTMDARGLQALPPGGEAQSASVRGVSAYSGAMVRNQFDTNFASQETLTTLASDTGGKAFLDTNDFSGIFRKVQEDTSAYYVLSYRSTNQTKDGHFRRITVKTTVPNAKLEYRSGYYAPKDFTHFNKADREQQMEEELTAELSSTDVGLYMTAAYFRLSEDRYFVPVSLIVPGSQIPFARASDKDNASLDVIGVVLEKKSRFPVANVRETVKLSFEGAQNVKGKNVQYGTGFVLAPGAYHIKFVVRENQSGRVGSFETDITVPDLKRDSKHLKMSSIVMGGQLKTVVKANKENPLVRDGQELVPNVAHVFSSDQHLYLYYEVYDPAKGQGLNIQDAAAQRTPAKGDIPNKSISVLSSVQIFHGKVKVFETPLVEVSNVAPDRRAAVFQLDVPLGKLSPGYYTCQVNVIDDRAGQFSFPRLNLLLKEKSIR